MLYTPSNDVEAMLNRMLRQSQYQHENNIKVIIRDESRKKQKRIEREKKKQGLKCNCPPKFSLDGKNQGSIMLRRFEDTGYRRPKCPIHSPQGHHGNY